MAPGDSPALAGRPLTPAAWGRLEKARLSISEASFEEGYPRSPQRGPRPPRRAVTFLVTVDRVPSARGTKGLPGWAFPPPASARESTAAARIFQNS